MHLHEQLKMYELKLHDLDAFENDKNLVFEFHNQHQQFQQLRCSGYKCVNLPLTYAYIIGTSLHTHTN